MTNSCTTKAAEKPRSEWSDMPRKWWQLEVCCRIAALCPDLDVGECVPFSTFQNPNKLALCFWRYTVSRLRLFAEERLQSSGTKYLFTRTIATSHTMIIKKRPHALHGIDRYRLFSIGGQVIRIPWRPSLESLDNLMPNRFKELGFLGSGSFPGRTDEEITQILAH